jgi:hypothetical protein
MSGVITPSEEGLTTESVLPIWCVSIPPLREAKWAMLSRIDVRPSGSSDHLLGVTLLLCVTTPL